MPGGSWTTLAAADVTAKIAAVEHEEATARASVDEARRRVEELVAQLQAERQRERELAESAQAARREALETEGRIVSLDALQRAALGESSAQVVEWLAASGLAGRPRLAQQLTVDPGWERAVETVLGAYLEAVCVDSIDDVAGHPRQPGHRHGELFRRRARARRYDGRASRPA